MDRKVIIEFITAVALSTIRTTVSTSRLHIIAWYTCAALAKIPLQTTRTIEIISFIDCGGVYYGIIACCTNTV
jgi:hypothetical protein